MKNRRFAQAAALLLFYGTFAVKGAFAAADSGGSELSLPGKFDLTDAATPVYDAMNGGKLYNAAPQTVQVTGAEEGWERKLLDGNDAVWFRIQTSGGERWVSLQNPALPEEDYEYVVLTGEENLYNQRSAKAESIGTVSPQVVRAIYSDNGYYRIQTWLGYKWIHPQHRVVEGVQYYGRNSSGLGAPLETVTPMFAVPDAGSEGVGWLSPQEVQAKMARHDGWLYVDTWQGPRWINTHIGYPKDLRKQEASLTLTGQTIVYEYPSMDARRLGALSPQTVESFERGSGWYHIRSDWLGDAWVYHVDADIDPAKYTAPQTVVPKRIDRDWTMRQSVTTGTWRNFPLDMTVIVSNGDQINPNQVFAFGQPTGIRFTVKNESRHNLTLSSSTIFKLRILRQADNGGGEKPEVVWSGELSAPKDPLESGVFAQASFEWDQRDADGEQVPYGLYNVEIELPMTIDYAETDTDTLQQQKADSAILTHFPLRIGAP